MKCMNVKLFLHIRIAATHIKEKYKKIDNIINGEINETNEIFK